jgi:hypothetical protein
MSLKVRAKPLVLRLTALPAPRKQISARIRLPLVY